MSNFHQYIYNSDSCDPMSERVRRGATSRCNRSRDETGRDPFSDAPRKPHPAVGTIHKGVMAETKAPATFQDIVWTPRPDASKDHSTDRSARSAQNRRVKTRANEPTAYKDIMWTRHPDASKDNLQGSTAHRIPRKPMKSQANNTVAFQEIVWTPRPDAIQDHSSRTSAVEPNITLHSQDNLCTRRSGASDDHLPGGSARTTPNKPLKALANETRPFQDIVWTPTTATTQDHSPGTSALGTQHSREKDSQYSKWTQRPGASNHLATGNSVRSAPQKSTNVQAIQDIVWTPLPDATKANSLDSSAHRAPHSRVVANEIEASAYQDIVWTRPPDASTDHSSGRTERGTVHEFTNAPAAESQGIARTPNPGVSKYHSPVDAPRGTRNADVTCQTRNPAVFQEIVWTPSLVESNQHSPDVDGAKIKPNEQCDHPRESTRRGFHGRANAERLEGERNDCESILMPKTKPTRMTDDRKVSNPTTDADSDDESTYTSFDIPSKASTRLIAHLHPGNGGMKTGALADTSCDEYFEDDKESADTSSHLAEKVDSLLQIKPQRKQHSATGALSIASSFVPSEESDDDENDYFEDDEFDEFRAYIPQSLILSDPDSSDVITCASAPDQAFNDDASVIDDAFQGELWTSLHPKASIRTSNDAPQLPPPQKSNVYSDLVVPSTQRPTFSNPYRRHAWQANPVPPLPSKMDSPASPSIALKNAELYSKIDERLLQVSARNDLDDLRRSLEDLKTSTKGTPSKEAI